MVSGRVGSAIALLRERGPVPRMIVASLVVGSLVGVIVAGFERLTVEVLLDRLVERPLWQQATAPAIGLALTAVILRWVGDSATSSTSDEYVRAYHARTPNLPLRHLPAKFFAGVTTIGFGGAVGLEGPSVYIGSSVGQNIQSRLDRYFRREERKMLLTAGAAAGIAAIFQAPATGVIFALEAPYRDDVARRALLPSLLAAAASYTVFAVIVGTDSVLPFLGREQRELRLGDIGGGAVLGLLAGLGGRGFSAVIRRSKEMASELPVAWRVAVGGAVLATLAIASDALFEETVTVGPGFRALDWLTDPDRSLGLIAALFAFRVVATVTTIGAGGTGGLFIPLAVQGVIMGSFVGEVIDHTDTSLYPTLGLAAFLGAGYRAPIAAVMFVAESTGAGASYVVPALIAAAVSQLVAGSTSIAGYQESVRLGHLERRFTLPITSALTTDVFTSPPDATASEFVYVHVLGRRERVVPVVDSGRYLGMCSLEQLGTVDRDDWDTTTVGELMQTELPAAGPSWTLRDAVAAMEGADVELLAVVDADGNFIGVVRADDIVKLDEILDETGG